MATEEKTLSQAPEIRSPWFSSIAAPPCVQPSSKVSTVEESSSHRGSVLTSSGHAREAGVTTGCLDYGLERAALEKLGENHSCHVSSVLQCHRAQTPLPECFYGKAVFEVSVWGSEVHLSPGREGPFLNSRDPLQSSAGCPHWLWLLLLPAAGPPQACPWERWEPGAWWGCQAQFSPFLAILSQ